MKHLFIFTFFITLPLLAQTDREKFYKRIEDKKIRDKVETYELEALRKGKKIESELIERNSGNKAVQDFFEFKKTLTHKKKIKGEEFEVLKDAAVLRKEFNDKKQAVINTWRKEQKLPAKTPVREQSILYPVPVRPVNSIALERPYRLPESSKTVINERRSKFPIIPLVALSVLIIIIFFFLRKKRT